MRCLISGSDFLVQLTAVPASIAPLSLDPCTPSIPDAERSENASPAFDKASLPAGLITIDGVPFQVGDKVLSRMSELASAALMRLRTTAD